MSATSGGWSMPKRTPGFCEIRTRTVEYSIRDLVIFTLTSLVHTTAPHWAHNAYTFENGGSPQDIPLEVFASLRRRFARRFAAPGKEGKAVVTPCELP